MEINHELQDPNTKDLMFGKYVVTIFIYVFLCKRLCLNCLICLDPVTGRKTRDVLMSIKLEGRVFSHRLLIFVFVLRDVRKADSFRLLEDSWTGKCSQDDADVQGNCFPFFPKSH